MSVFKAVLNPTNAMNFLKKTAIDGRPGTALHGTNESFKYTAGLISMQLRLSPESQDTFEKRLKELQTTRDAKAATVLARYDNAIKDAESARAKSLAEATDTYQTQLRALFVEFKKSEPKPSISTTSSPLPLTAAQRQAAAASAPKPDVAVAAGVGR